MLTLFAVPRAFAGDFAAIQRTAFESWVALRPAPEVILLGDDEGTAETARAFGFAHVPEMARNELGTPLLDSVFEWARRLATNDVLCFVNADIVLLDDFSTAVARVAALRERFLMIGECLNLDPGLAAAELRTGRLAEVARARGRSRGAKAIDYFVFPRDLYADIPPFSIGRPRWDNWLVWRARDLGATVVDATPVVVAVHQDHHYNVPPGQSREDSPEARRNHALAGGPQHLYFVWDASHRLTRRGLRANPGSWFRIRNRVEELRGKALWRARWLRDAARALQHDRNRP